MKILKQKTLNIKTKILNTKTKILKLTKKRKRKYLKCAKTVMWRN